MDLLGGAARESVPFSAYLFYKYAEHIEKPCAPDPWGDLRAHTAARLALGRAGTAIPTRELLDFGLAHAYAMARVLRLADGPDEVHRQQLGRFA